MKPSLIFLYLFFISLNIVLFSVNCSKEITKGKKRRTGLDPEEVEYLKEIKEIKLEAAKRFEENKDPMYFCDFMTEGVTENLCYLIPHDVERNLKCCYLTYKDKVSGADVTRCYSIEDTEYSFQRFKNVMKKHKKVKIKCNLSSYLKLSWFLFGYFVMFLL